MEKTNLKYMGALFKTSRLNLNLTQEQLAETVGITARYIMAIENEEKCPSLDIWMKLIRTLKISADSIVYPEQEFLKDDDESLVLMLKMLDRRDKRVIKATMQEMLETK